MPFEKDGMKSLSTCTVIIHEFLHMDFLISSSWCKGLAREIFLGIMATTYPWREPNELLGSEAEHFERTRRKWLVKKLPKYAVDERHALPADSNKF